MHILLLFIHKGGSCMCNHEEEKDMVMPQEQLKRNLNDDKTKDKIKNASKYLSKKYEKSIEKLSKS